VRAVTPGDPTTVTRRSYNLIAGDYAVRNPAPSPRFGAWCDAWVGAVRADAGTGTGWRAGAVGVARPRVLDAGAGPGQYAAAFVAAGLRPVALDASDAMVALCRTRGVPVVLGDMRRPPFAAGSFDAVWSAASLLHVPRDEVPATLRAWRRVAVPGARLGLTTASGGVDGWEDPPYDTGGERPPPRWFVYHDAPALTALLAGAGWRVVSVSHQAGARRWVMLDAVATEAPAVAGT
jgi:SAM-dependent methyltransferase